MRAVEAVLALALVNSSLEYAQTTVPVSQPELVLEGNLSLTVTKLERLTTFIQVNRTVTPRTGFEFGKAHFVAKWSVPADRDPCDALDVMRDPRTGVRPGEFELVDVKGVKVRGTTRVRTWVPLEPGARPPQTCEFTIVFQESPAGSQFAKIRLKAAETDISKLPGAR